MYLSKNNTFCQTSSCPMELLTRWCCWF